MKMHLSIPGMKLKNNVISKKLTSYKSFEMFWQLVLARDQDYNLLLLRVLVMTTQNHIQDNSLVLPPILSNNIARALTLCLSSGWVDHLSPLVQTESMS